MKWITEITDVNEPYSFVDIQKSGPYKFWRHEHTFVEKNNGIEMTDKVSYSIGYWIVGNIINEIIVSKKLKSIFEYRFTILDKIFN